MPAEFLHRLFGLYKDGVPRRFNLKAFRLLFEIGDQIGKVVSGNLSLTKTPRRKDQLAKNISIIRGVQRGGIQDR